jgi:hypothetical protein
MAVSGAKNDAGPRRIRGWARTGPGGKKATSLEAPYLQSACVLSSRTELHDFIANNGIANRSWCFVVINRFGITKPKYPSKPPTANVVGTPQHTTVTSASDCLNDSRLRYGSSLVRSNWGVADHCIVGLRWHLVWGSRLVSGVSASSRIRHNVKEKECCQIGFPSVTNKKQSVHLCCQAHHPLKCKHPPDWPHTHVSGWQRIQSLGLPKEIFAS